ncbi:thioredoxin family protein [Oxalobacteraceae bacterium OM1]|nr:thioredoxin family protein [Oxalobacteraceae bacterium OM1]
MSLRPLVLAAALCALLPAAAFAAAPASSAAHADGIAWFKGDVDSAFAQAKSSNKPVFLYWGAVWCPPCNQVKATIFNRQSFIERSRAFVPVYLDGDSPDGQKLGARFKVRGYPTMILFKPDGTEITRLPGEVDAERYMQVLTLSMNATRPVKDLLQAALTEPAQLKADDWRLLSDYSWDTDEQQLIGKKDLPATLQKLAAACPPGENALRLQLKSVVAASDPKAEGKVELDKAAAAARIEKMLADKQATRDNADQLANYAPQVVNYLTPEGPQRQALANAWGQAMQRLADDATLSRADRLTALTARASLAQDADGKVDPKLAADVRRQVAEIEKATTDAYERQAVVSAGADALAEAGLMDESDALLKAELKRSHSPYYFMLGLAANAKKRGDKAAALDWYDQAYKAAKGPATRLQWGVTYLNGLLDLAPTDEKRIETTSRTVFTELGGMKDAFYERNRAYLERFARKLAQWNKEGKHAESVQRVSAQLENVCGKLPEKDAQRAACRDVVDTARVRS